MNNAMMSFIYDRSVCFVIIKVIHNAVFSCFWSSSIFISKIVQKRNIFAQIKHIFILLKTCINKKNNHRDKNCLIYLI